MSQVSALPSSSSYINDHTPGHSNSKPPDSATDPAELLRRAALSSRKLKRRKLDASASVASLSRPLSRRSIASTHSISLDYGQEEPSSTPTTSQPPPAAAPARAPTPTVSHRLGSPDRDVQRGGSAGAAPQTPLVDDASTREEGEISDDEDPPFRLPSKQIPAPVTAAGAAYADMKPEASGSVRSPPFGVASRSPSVRVEDSYQRANLLGSVTTPVRLPSIEAQPAALNSPSESITLETPDYVLDPDHVRPGLSLTQKQYDTVKEVILDILGYGVPPEYLVDCGISKEMIYYVFTELNLRLPSNLVTRGIHPYPPPLDVIESILRSQSGYPLSPSATVDSNAEGDTARPASVGHRNPSPCPPAPHESAATGVPQVAMTSTDGSLSASVLALSESTLTAIERQRKQELLARKAVQASRKRKEILPLSIARDSAASTNAASPGADVSAMSSASAVSVEDFFKSIELPLSGDFRDPDGAPGFPKHSSPEPMRVDEVIPGFGRSVVSEHAQPLPSVTKATAHRPSEDTSLPRSTSVEEFVEREKELPTHEATHALKDLPTRPRGDGTPATHLTREIEREPRRSSTTPQPTAPVPRRGAKRPVAADFDSEPMPKTYTPPVPSRASSDMGFGNGAGHHLNPHVRRKINGAMAGGFASLNSARRCVIDVSDSEDDTSEEETGSTAEAPRGPGPQGGESGGGPSSAGDSALALELEIERMRKMIREREETKLRKQAMASSRSTPVSRESPAMCRGMMEGDGEASVRSASSLEEMARSETGNDKASKNVLATRLDVNCSSPISSTPSPPRFPPLSPVQDTTSRNAQPATTDQSATPADAIGGPALPPEPRPESAASSRASAPPHPTRHSPESGPEGESVDVVASAQISNNKDLQVMAESSFIPYHSVLSHYPFLSGHSLGPQEMPDLKGLRTQAAARRMTANGLENARICQFEVPGGGECRDRSCGDMHLSQFQMEPNDEETARFLCGDQDQNVAQTVEALQAARTRRPQATFDERVKEVWTSVMRGRRIQMTFDDKT